MGFIRFILATTHPNTGVEEGLFSLAYRMREDGEVNERDRLALTELMAWFDQNLPVPDRFNRTRSKGYYRRATRGITWLRDTARESATKMYQLKEILEAYGHSVSVIHETRVGYIVDEDELQVVAEPFADTQTGPRG